MYVFIDMLYIYRLVFKNYVNIMNYKNKLKFVFRLYFVIYNNC